jgi:chorismate-pyruvate lyase
MPAPCGTTLCTSWVGGGIVEMCQCPTWALVPTEGTFNSVEICSATTGAQSSGARAQMLTLDTALPIPEGSPLLIDISFDHDDPVEHVGTGRITSPRNSGPTRSATLVLAEALTGLQGTVTEYLEDLVKERVYADKLQQVQTTASGANRLSVELGHPLTRRIVLLRGQQSSLAYLYAETLLVSSRIPWTTRNRLEISTDPIGRVLSEQGSALTRVPLPSEREYPKAIDHFILAREYRVDLGGLPVMEISEWFLPALEDFIFRQQ